MKPPNFEATFFIFPSSINPHTSSVRLQMSLTCPRGIREYGFIDAIYITGDTDYCFYRDKDAARHDIGDSADYSHEKWKGIIPWLVFRKE